MDIYEKKYKEALSRARAACGTGAYDDLTLEFIFPELAESEDKKIRKELIEQVGYILPDNEEYDEEGRVLPTYHKRIGRYRAWLEKQKEQKLTPSRETILGIWELGNLWKENPEKREGLSQLEYIQKYWAEKCDYLIEQKPAEDERIRKHIIEILGRLSPLNFDWNEKGQCIAYLNRQAAQKPLWDEKDESNLKAILDSTKSLPREWRDWLYDLPNRFNLSQIQEWSEEDEENIKWFTNLVVSQSSLSEEWKDKCISWLKSLRPQPHWKPSEEQIRALERAIVRFNSVDDIPILTELRDKLKKL